MAKRNNVSPEARMAFQQLKEEIARELGVYDTVKKHGWGEVSSRNCGNIVKKALEKKLK
ncbi:small acid-soluble spore protein F (minor alpha/beta-type SASP) [Caminicella sporogenes DSM 14501]|uniref:Small acid-soluble spore protein F (Minor alpha/beta-type SASP) n=1 Tax=Caminicella sporogenes DSM 14501 TaxID=1121266 RepID=A0A1M6PCB6_9FIRM|nr:small, acid-soluble spore protein, alpha/beta type [Caminicella sporogenes]RKD21451.1 small, acid-soluble spore protein, alpha/beta type [Caminicella sporogenes]WIF95406.1 small, acid-soluble spore protein, alpha/beta type [Caminicella sporogenes]SHK05595.1 small acid-soluble spore protein F (minor alpha/beta-type SASP) [Caminicella sporogenes DSM 14501]